MVKKICLQGWRPRFNPWIGKIWRRKWQSTRVFLPGESHRESSLVGQTQLMTSKHWSKYSQVHWALNCIKFIFPISRTSNAFHLFVQETIVGNDRIPHPGQGAGLQPHTSHQHPHPQGDDTDGVRLGSAGWEDRWKPKKPMYKWKKCSRSLAKT